MIEYNVTNDPKPKFTIVFENRAIDVTLEYLPTQEVWMANFDLDDNELLYGVVLNSALPIFDTYNKPFDFYINDVNDLGLSPFDIENFTNAFYSFNRIERDELNKARGYEVE